MKQQFIVIFFLLPLMLVCGQERGELERRKESAQRDIEIARDLLNKTQDKRKNTLNRIAVLDRGIRSREEVISDIEQELLSLDEELAIMEQEIFKIEKNIKKGKEEYAEIIKAIYKNHTEEEKMMYLLASENINQFYQRIKYIRYLKDYREKKVLELEMLSVELEEKKEELLEIKNQKQELLLEKEEENRKLLNERNNRNSMVRQLAQDERRIRQQIREKERIRKELEEKIRAMIEAEARKSSSNSLVSSLTPEQKLVGNSFTQNRGRLPWPVERGVITAEFGLIDHPVLKGVKINNNGVDISTSPGAKARVIFDGEITSIFAILGANYAVIVQHGEYLSVYQNLENLTVKVGDKVKAKQTIGTVHADSGDDIAILHLQIWKSKEILNPRKWLSK